MLLSKTQVTRQSGVATSMGPFDIITPNRIYTLIPLPPSEEVGAYSITRVKKPTLPTRSPSHDIWETTTTENYPHLSPNDENSREQTKLRQHSSSISEVSYITAPETTSLFSFSCCAPVISVEQHKKNQQIKSSSHRNNRVFDATNATLCLKDFEQCIVDASLISTPRDAGGTVAKLLLKRDGNTHI